MNNKLETLYAETLREIELNLDVYMRTKDKHTSIAYNTCQWNSNCRSSIHINCRREYRDNLMESFRENVIRISFKPLEEKLKIAQEWNSGLLEEINDIKNTILINNRLRKI